MKKGQVTVFIILGIVIVVVFGLLWHGTTTAPSLSVDNTAITDHVSSCLSTVATRGVYKLAAQGGYINPKGDIAYGEEGDAFPAHYYLGAHALSYVLDGNASSMRRLPAMTAALSRYIAVELSSCLNFTELELQGYTVNAPSIDWEAINFDFPQASVPYSPQPLRFSIIPRADSQDIAVVANYPIQVIRADQSFVATEFVATIPLRLDLLDKTARKLINEIALAHSNATAYNLFNHCAEYASPDHQINIYSTWNPYAHDYAVSIVDADPLARGMPPLRFQFAIRNVNFGGFCVG